MKYVDNALSEKHKELSKIIRRSNEIDEVKKLFLEIHGATHRSVVSEGAENDADRIFSGLSDRDYRIMPSAKDETIAWAIWHMARIEDITMNLLLGNIAQVFDDDWKKRINTDIVDTGNAMTDDEIMAFSKKADIEQLLLYRDAVGRKTRDLIRSFPAESMKRKVSPDSLDKVLRSGGIINREKSVWLLNYWAGKDMAGLILMPATRHNILHLNDCGRMKEELRTRKKFFHSC